MLQKIWSVVASLTCCLSAVAAETDTPEDTVAQLIQDHTEFAASLYSAVATSSSNVVFSPYSISTCLSMVFLGARNETADEIQTTLHLNLDRDQISSATLALAQQLEPKSKDANNYQLNLANALWLDEQTYTLSDFSHALESAFRAKVGRINFAKTDNAIQTINQWVSDQTSAKITDLLLTGDIDENTRLVLTNAVYFQGSFTKPFDEKQTKDKPFHPTPDTSATVSMMQQTTSAPYMENDLFQLLALPFVSKNGAKMALAILLPRSTDNLVQIENEFKEAWNEWISALKFNRVTVQLPKFKVKKRLDLNAILQQLGMKIPFTTQANFSGIDGKLDLYLSKVVNEALIDVNEAGVVAAAATAA